MNQCGLSQTPLSPHLSSRGHCPVEVMSVKGLNYTESVNRFRFENLSERLQHIDVDIIHRAHLSGTLRASQPESGPSGCYFQDELENLKDLCLTPPFKRFYYKIWPLVQSLPELLLNLKKIVEILIEQLNLSSVEDLPTYLQLVAVLARDTQDDFFPFFHKFFSELTSVINKVMSGTAISIEKSHGPNPELIGKIFECMSHLIRYQLSSLAKDPDCLRPYYGPLVGHRTLYVREFTAQMLTIFLRKLSVKQFRSHFKHIFRAIALSFNGKHLNSLELNFETVMCLPIPRLEVNGTEDVSVRIQDLLDGVSEVLFTTLKGIKNCLHSKGSEYLGGSLSLMLPLSATVIDEIHSSCQPPSNTKKQSKIQAQEHKINVIDLSASSQKEILSFTLLDVLNMYCAGRVLTFSIRKLFRHCHPKNMDELWLRCLSHIEGLTKLLKTFFCLSEPSMEIAGALEISASFTVELIYFVLAHSNRRALSNSNILKNFQNQIIRTIMSFGDCYLTHEVQSLSSIHHKPFFSIRLASRIRAMICCLWICFPSMNETKSMPDWISLLLGQKLVNVQPKSIDLNHVVQVVANSVKCVCRDIFPHLSREIIRQLLIKPVFVGIISIRNNAGDDSSIWVTLFHEILNFIYDPRERFPEILSSDSEVTTTENSLISSCSNELNMLVVSCFSLVDIDVPQRLENTRKIISQKHEIIYACRCLSWVMKYHSSIFEDENMKSRLLKFLNKLKHGLSPIFLDNLSNFPTLHLVFAHLLITYCDAIKFSLVSDPAAIELKQYLLNELAEQLVEKISENSTSLSLLWAFQYFLHSVVCPFLDIVSGPESHRNILISLLSSQKQELLIQSLSSSLLNPSFWIRHFALRILFYFPPPALIQTKKLVSNDFTERDLDDEIDQTERSVYDVVRLCYEASCLPACVGQEREFARILGQLEVYIRSGKLPVEYSRIVPLWNPAISVLISAVNNDETESVAWPLILRTLEYLNNKEESETTINTELINNDPISCLELVDCGEPRVPFELAESSTFYFRFARSTDSAIVPLDARTDVHTTFETVWEVFRKSPSITLKHSKIVIPMFVRFLRDQYYSKFPDDPELPAIQFTKLFQIPSLQSIETKLVPNLPIPILKKRLILFLKVFAAVLSPKQLYHHQALYKYYCVILSKPDTVMTKLALDCILTYKPEGLLPYQHTLKNFFDDSCLRNELLVFDPSLTTSLSGGSGNGGIEINHRAILIPVIIRILFGRFVSKPKGSKSAKDQALARRNAVLSFLAKIPGEELETLIQLMLRGLVPPEKMIRVSKELIFDATSTNQAFEDNWMNSWNACTMNLIESNLSMEDIQSVSWERQIGFLFLLEQAIKILGFNLTHFVPLLSKILILLLNSAHSLKNNCLGPDDSSGESGEEDFPEALHEVSSTTRSDTEQSGRVRAMCLRRLSEFVDQYQSVVDFSSSMRDVWFGLENLLIALPGSLSGGLASNSRAPALLKLLNSLVSHDSTIEIVSSRQDIVKILIQCVGAHRASYSVVQLIMNSLNLLLNYREGIALLPHSELIIQSFTSRFVGSDFSGLVEVKLSELKIKPTGSVKEELRLLTAIASNIFTRKDVDIGSKSITNLSTLLLGMLRTYTTSKKIRVEEDWAINILTIYRCMLWRVPDVRPHVPFISRLFGPASHSQSLFNLASVRCCLQSVYEELSNHSSTLGVMLPSCKSLKKMVAVDSKLIDTRDFGECMPVFQSLSEEASLSTDFTWDNLMGPTRCHSSREMTLCNVVIYECLRCMYDREFVVRTASLAALKVLMTCAARWSCIIDSDHPDTLSYSRMDPIKVIIMPGIYQGLKFTTDAIKKGFIQLLSYVVKTIGSRCQQLQDKDNFHFDLFFLTNQDADQDFFENISHIQFHRRTRILGKLRGLLSESSCNISTRSFVHVLLPLAFHPLLSDEFKKKELTPLLQEASALIGTIALHLNWSQYYSLMKSLLKQLQKENVEKEKYLIGTLCSVLGSFHFEMTPNQINNLNDDIESESEEEPEDTPVEISPIIPGARNISDCVINTIYPGVKAFLLKPGKDRDGNKTDSVRTTVAVALVKLLKRFEPPVMSAEKRNSMFTNLVLNVVNTLKSRDPSVRDIARESLSKMVSSMGLESLTLVLTELEHNLTEGYQRHVRNYTVRSLLSEVLEGYSPPVEAISVPITSETVNLDMNFEHSEVTPFDQCIPQLIEFCLDDICGAAFEDRKVEDANRSLIREAKGNKANDILEICGRSLLFRPSYALINHEKSSVHLLVSPLLEVLRNSETDSNESLVGRTTEALQRISIGLAKNPSVKATELFLYLHSTLTPFVSKLFATLRTRKLALGQANVDQNQEEDILSTAVPSYLQDESSDDEDSALFSKKTKVDQTNQMKANIWLPSERKTLKGQRAAVDRRNEEQKSLHLVQDGASAPRLTGRNKYKRKNHHENITDDDPAFNAAVKFCLSLLLSCLKQNKLDGNDEIVKSMALPFLPLFAQCLRVSGNSGIVVLAMRCICGLLNWDLSVDPAYSRAVGKRMLGMMYKGGAVLSTDNDLVQTCIKGLVSLFQTYNKSKNAKNDESILNQINSSNDEVITLPILPKKQQESLPLDIESVRSLISLLTASILEVASTYQNSAFQLIRSIVDSKIIVPEIYDLMKTLIEQIVLSHRKGVRDLSSNIIISFILTYPLGKKRLEAHLKQFIQNCSYEYEEGRLAALDLLTNLSRLLPIPILDEYLLLIFLPMSSLIVNDISPKCRTHAGDVIISLCRRCSPDLAEQCLSYSLQWLGIFSGSTNLEVDVSSRCVNSLHRPLMRTGAQVASLIILGRPEIFKKGKIMVNILTLIKGVLVRLVVEENAGLTRQSLEQKEITGPSQDLEGEGDGGGFETWALLYHILMLMERLYNQLPNIVDKTLTVGLFTPQSPLLMELIQEAMLYPHAWVRSVSCRILQCYLQHRNPLSSDFQSIAISCGHPRHSEILLNPNALYHLARRLCVVLNYPIISQSLLPSLMSCLVFVIRAMYHHPELQLDNSDEEEHRLQTEERLSESESEEVSVEVKSSSNWVIQRLRAIGGDSRGNRRANVIKIFLELIKVEDLQFIQSHIHQFVEVCLRATLSKREESNNPEEKKILLEIASEFLHELENRVGSSMFIGIYGEIQRRIENSKTEKKRRLAAEAVSDPKAFATRKVENSLKKRESKKRKSQNYAQAKGSKKKRGTPAIIYEEL